LKKHNTSSLPLISKSEFALVADHINRCIRGNLKLHARFKTRILIIPQSTGSVDSDGGEGE